MGPPPGPGWGPPPQAPKPGVIPLRPLGVGEILDGAVSYIRAHPKITLGLSALITTATQLILVPVQYLSLGELASLAGTAGTPPSIDELVDAVAGSGLAMLAGMVLGFITGTVLNGMLIVVLSRAVLGQRITLGQTWAATRPRLLGLLGLSLLTTLLLLTPLLLFVPAAAAGLTGAPGGLIAVLAVLGGLAAVAAVVYLYVALSLVAPVYMLEGIGVLAALRRSHRLVGRQWWRIFGVLLLAGVIAFVIAAIVSFPFSLAGGAASGFAVLGGEAPFAGATGVLTLTLGAIGTIVGGTITAPFTAGVTGLLYVDQRIRREALDLELARAAGVQPPPSGLPPAPSW